METRVQSANSMYNPFTSRCHILIHSDIEGLKGPFHEPTNYTYERQQRKKRDLHEQIIEVADECVWSSHCTVVANILFADQLKL